MNTISEILLNEYPNQGIQNMRVFYDSYIFNLKIKNGSEYNNVILIEKFSYDYDHNTIERIRNSLMVNFGDTKTSTPFLCQGTTFIDSILNKSKKIVYLIGIKELASNKIIPIIYQYNIVNHTIKPIFPNSSDITQFNDIPLVSSFINTKTPITRRLGKNILISFQTTDNTHNYLHRIIINPNNSKLISYDIFKYDAADNIDFKNVTESDILYKKSQYFGFLSQVNDLDGIADAQWSIFTLDDSNSILTLDNGLQMLSLDGFGIM